MPFHLYKGDDEPEKNEVGKHTDMIPLCATICITNIHIFYSLLCLL